MKSLAPFVLCLGLALTNSVQASSENYPPSAPHLVSGQYRFEVIEEIRTPDEVLVGSNSVDEGEPVYYFQNFGGSPAMGIALGPFGVLASGAMIKSNTKSDVEALKGRVDAKPVSLMKEAVHASGEVETSAKPVQIQPYLIFSKGDKDKVYAAYAADVSVDGWKGRYTRHLRTSYTVATLAAGLAEPQKEALTTELKHAGEDLVKLIRQDLENGLQFSKPVLVRSETVTPRFIFDVLAKTVTEDPDSVTVGLGYRGKWMPVTLSSGYHVFPRDQVIIKDR
ncbi:MAG TPA: hypothetical protein VFW49_14160 [Fluviicoccus sp.]|nr:hypothetical protein [Fluviicoccus sp.]